MDTVKEMVTSERADVYECDDCGEIVKVDTGETPDTCPVCGSDEFTLINRNAKA